MEKSRKAKYIILSIIILLFVLTKDVKADTATVSTDTLNLRSEASTSSNIVELLNSGDKLEIISEEGNWYKVKHNNNEGYVSKDYVKVTKSTTNATTATNTTTETGNTENGAGTTSSNTESGTGSSSNNAETGTASGVTTTAKLSKDTSVKITPLINSNEIAKLKTGTEVTIITKTNKWTFIETDEITGWVVSSNLQEEQTTNNSNDNSNSNNSDNSNTGSTNDSNSTDTSNNNTNSADTTSSTDTTYNSTKTMYVKGTSVYVRSSNSTDSNIVTTLIQNTDVTVTGEAGDWYKVKYNSYEGYIYKELLSDSKTETTNRGNVKRNIEVTPIAETSEEQSESTTTQTSEETNTNTQENESATTQESTETQSSTLGEEIVAYAKQYLGCPYVYGASGSSSFDCSGFTMYVYKHFGYSLSHSATAQSKVGTHVDKEDLQPGDLVFFLDYETMDGIGHCGIYIGDGNFIHASSGSGYCVKISTLTSGSYLKRYATACRLI